MKTTLLAFAVLALSNNHGIRASRVCCPQLPCFSDAAPYNGLPLPRCPQYLGIIVKLYTRTNPLDGEEYSRTKFPPSFSADRQLIYIVHGWTQSETAEWMHAMKDALLKKGDYNVAIVGWKGGSENFNYVQAAVDTRTVGAEIALLAQNAIAQGLQRDDLYCIGHSLGSHVCGYARQGIKFGRITGLDPASPTFEDRGLGLNTSCADFVDVIHTGGKLLAGLMRIGTKKPIGHVDFYPNGGETQPGCDGKDNKINLLDILMSKTLNDALAKIIGMAGPVCNHLRAVYFFIESIGTSRFVTSELCSSEKNLPLYCGKNDATIQNMGFNSTFSTARGIFYLTTNDKAPYCQS